MINESDDLYTFDDVLEELITRGIQRLEPKRELGWEKPFWWVSNRPDDASDSMPRRILFLAHPTSKDSPALFSVRSCSCCSAVRSVSFSILTRRVDEGNVMPECEIYATLTHWTGLDSALRLHSLITDELYDFTPAEAAQ